MGLCFLQLGNPLASQLLFPEFTHGTAEILDVGLQADKSQNSLAEGLTRDDTFFRIWK